jgi:hypothetical protein
MEPRGCSALSRLITVFDRFFFAPSDGRDLALFRTLYCGALACVHLTQMVRVEQLYASYFAVYFPTPLFFWLGLGQLPLAVVRAAGLVLLISLVCGARGGRGTRPALTLGWISFFLFYGTILGFEKPEPPTISPYTFHYNNIVPFHLFVLSIAPGISRWGVLELWRRESRGPLPHLSQASLRVPAWPVLLVKFTLALAYFGSGLAKVKASGALWMDGDTLQAYFLMRHLEEGAWVGYWLAQYYWVCVVLSGCTLALELSFIAVPFFPNSHPVTRLYVVAGLGFHGAIAATMNIVHFLPFMGLSYLIFLDWNTWRKWVGTLWPRARQERRNGPPVHADLPDFPATGLRGEAWRLWIPRCFIAAYVGVLLLGDVVGIELWPLSDYGVFRGRAHYRQIRVGQIRGVDGAKNIRWLRAQDLGGGFHGRYDGTSFIRFYLARSGRTTTMPTMEEGGAFMQAGPCLLRDFHHHLPSSFRERFHALEFVIRSIEKDADGWLVPSDRVMFSSESGDPRG